MKQLMDKLFKKSLLAAKKRQATTPPLVEIQADHPVVRAVVGGASYCGGIEGTG